MMRSERAMKKKAVTTLVVLRLLGAACLGLTGYDVLRSGGTIAPTPPLASAQPLTSAPPPRPRPPLSLTLPLTRGDVILLADGGPGEGGPGEGEGPGGGEQPDDGGSNPPGEEEEVILQEVRPGQILPILRPRR
jgi:hypothetical protein